MKAQASCESLAVLGWGGDRVVGSGQLAIETGARDRAFGTRRRHPGLFRKLPYDADRDFATVSAGVISRPARRCR
jgi:hypothetical protein